MPPADAIVTSRASVSAGTQAIPTERATPTIPPAHTAATATGQKRWGASRRGIIQARAVERRTPVWNQNTNGSMPPRIESTSAVQTRSLQ